MPELRNLPPLPGALLESLRSIGYTLDTSLADIIDNSISADCSSVSVHFRWNNGHPWIAVMDDGHGMDADELTQAMRFGSRSPLLERAKSDMGRFGLGMKTASISQCRWLTVLSKRNGKVAARAWNLNDISSNGEEQWPLTELDDSDLAEDQLVSGLLLGKLSGIESGTIVLWRELDCSLIGEGQASDEKRFSELARAACPARAWN